MKVIELTWGFMSNTYTCPTLVDGVINSFTYFYKGEGHSSGRFPKVFAIVTDAATASSVTVHRGDPCPANRVSFQEMIHYYGVRCRDEKSARKLAEKMAENPAIYQDNDLYLAGNIIRRAPKLEVGKTITVRSKGERPYKTVVVEIPDEDSCDRCVGCPWHGCAWYGCNHPIGITGGRSPVCTLGDDSGVTSFMRLMKLEHK